MDASSSLVLHIVHSQVTVISIRKQPSALQINHTKQDRGGRARARYATYSPQMDADADYLLQRCFVTLVALGVLYLAAVTFRLLDFLGIPSSLRRPMDLRRRYGAWAVVTGPTSGIGRSMALELARRGLNVVLVGRDPDKLLDISDAITKAHAVQTKTVVFDFSLVSTRQGRMPQALSLRRRRAN